MLLFEWASLFETVGFKLTEGKGLREGWDSKELWKSVEKSGHGRLKVKTPEEPRQKRPRSGFHKCFEMSTMYADVVRRLRWRARESLPYGLMEG